MKIQVVSTCHREGWEKYGKRMVESFLVRWPDDISMVFFPEGFDPDIDDPRFSVAQFPDWLWFFRNRNKSAPTANGKFSRGYDYKFDAIRFAFKTAAVIESFYRCRADWLVWVDADIFFHSDVSHAFLESLFDPNADIAWLYRSTMYPECGFYFINVASAKSRQIIDRWRYLLESDEIFLLKEWHDSFVLEHVVHELRGKTESLSGKFAHHSHPAINGPLGAVLDHMKGPRKFEGKSRPGDLRAERPEEYWKGKR